MYNFLKPGSKIGIIGGGQLGRMLALSFKASGFFVIVLDPQIDCPCASVSDEHIIANYNDINAINDLAEKSDIITYEFENIDYSVLKSIETNNFVAPNSRILNISKNRILEKTFINDLGINTAEFSVVKSYEDLIAALDKISFPSILKTNTGGYDGKGQLILKSNKDLDKAKELINSAECILEKFVEFDFEASIIIARNLNNESVCLPVVENIHVNNILHITKAPANIAKDVLVKINDIATKIADELKLVGLLTIELFITKNAEVFVNEIAPRPHNSGHYSIEACDLSQFELHKRAICNLPLKKPKLFKKAIMVNVLGQHVEKVMEQIPYHNDWFIHFYGKKDAKYNRKMGHITILSNNVDKTITEINETNIW